MEVIGKVKKVNAEQQVSATFKKRELVVTTDEQYPQDILIEFVQDKCDLLNDLQVGQNVTVGINLSGREWINPQGETKYFNSIKGWRIDKANELHTSQPELQKGKKELTEPLGKENEPDDLPF
jgi:hypothetical protein